MEIQDGDGKDDAREIGTRGRPRGLGRGPSGRGLSQRRSGGVRSTLSALVLLGVALGTAVWLGDRSETRSGSSGIASPPSRDPGSEDLGRTGSAETGRTPRREAGAPAPGAAPAAAPSAVPSDSGSEPSLAAGPSDAELARRFSGTGRLRGMLEVDPGIEFPERWSLVLAPSRLLTGREHAVERRIELAGGEREFEVAPLPLAGYDVHAEAPGARGLVQPVLLDRASPEAYVVLRLAHTVFLQGDVFDADGAPAEGVPVHVTSKAGAGAQATTTDALGRYRFEDLSLGAWELVLGHPDRPILGPRSLRTAAPGLTFPPLTMPRLGSAEIHVLDGEDRPLPGASVVGAGTRGGDVDGTTDDEGLLVVRHLPEGRYRVRAIHPDGSASGDDRTAFHVRPGESVRVVLRVAP